MRKGSIQHYDAITDSIPDTRLITAGLQTHDSARTAMPLNPIYYLIHDPFPFYPIHRMPLPLCEIVHFTFGCYLTDCL